ncbi:hypothetical protein FACS1894186_1530 [Alphaproteobacteria bacterium]|nr:hypothetical protein FACS1894186_1530 [Alphaproteobacteria bacterium]
MKHFAPALAVAGFLALLSRPAAAVCPVCTVAIAGTLGILEFFGIDDLVGGLWIGALVICFVILTQQWLNKKGWRAWWVKVLNVLCYYGFTFSVYLLPDRKFGANAIWGVDKLALGIVCGTMSVVCTQAIYLWIKKLHGGHPWFPFQKIVMQLFDLGVWSVVFYYLTKGDA